MRRLLLVLLALLVPALPARAHVGNKDVFEEVSAGPYRLFVTIRPPNVIPGVATVEVRASGPAVTSMSITPIPLTGEAARHPPSSDPMKVSAIDPAFYTGSLWLMASGSWQVRIRINGPAGAQTVNIPVPAMPLAILPMQRSLGVTLAVLGLFLVVSMAGIVAAAVREARLPPGTAPDEMRRRRALIAMAGALAVMALFVYGGARWWKVEAAVYSHAIYHPLTLVPKLSGGTLQLAIVPYVDPASTRRSRANDDLLPDHGHLMHLYAIREPEMDAVFHLHPALISPGNLGMTLPSMPAGTYRLYGDIVHASGFPETLMATLSLPADLPPGPLSPEDASALPPPISAGELGSEYKLPDGYTMVWERPATLTANTAYALRFRLLDGRGQPAGDMEPYLGMAGHAAFVKTDGTTFAHTHPEGSAAMQAMDLANPGAMAGMEDMAAAAAMSSPASHPKISSMVEFPYGFPSAGRYRIFIQMKHGGTVETGVFDADIKQPI